MTLLSRLLFSHIFSILCSTQFVSLLTFPKKIPLLPFSSVRRRLRRREGQGRGREEGGQEGGREEEVGEVPGELYTVL